MVNQIDKSNFGYLNEEFQYKLAKCFIEDHKFFERLATIVDQNAFTDSLLRRFVGELKNYYQKNNVVPSYDTMLTILLSKARTVTESEEFKAIVNKLHFQTDFEGMVVIQDMAVRFFKQQNLIHVANKILSIAGQGDIDKYDECKKLLDDASLAGEENEYGYSPFDLEDKALSLQYKVHIPTGIDLLDDSLNGGLEKQKIGIIIGSAGFGKSTFSTAISSYASTFRCDMNNNEGYKVLQIYFEDEDNDIARKHFSRITGTEARNLSRTKQDADEIREVLANYPDRETMSKNLRLKSFRTGTKSASDIELFIRRLINTGFKPDLVILDYFECLLPEKGGYQNDSEWSREGKTMRKLENMAKDLDIALWVPTQGNKGSITADLVTMDGAGGSIKKVQIGHVIISIARSLEDQDKNVATLAMLKNRSGKSGQIWRGIRFDNGTSTISCENVMQTDDALTYKAEVQRVNESNRIDMIRKLQN